MTNKKPSCRYCLQCFSSSRVLEYLVKNCLSSNHMVLLPEENKYINFQNFKRLTKVSSIINGDFGPNTKKHQNHIISSCD